MNAGETPATAGPGADPLPILTQYSRHLEATAQWLLRSVAREGRGSRAYVTIGGIWSRPDPETTGHIIPSLLRLAEALRLPHLQRTALRLGDWLLAIQHPQGYWQGEFYSPQGRGRPSIFATAQILRGMIALYRLEPELRWRRSAEAAARWLAARLDDDSSRPGHGPRAEGTPPYYVRAAWPMLEAGQCLEVALYLRAGEQILARILDCQLDSGGRRLWGWHEGTAFTHSIAYTLRGFLEAARVLGDWATYGSPVERVLEKLVRLTELSGGRLAGAYDEQWRRKGKYLLPTGQSQLALCLMIWEGMQPDLRLVSAAAKLVDHVCATQLLWAPLPWLRGAVPGSCPVWGKYMSFRYPSWAAQSHADALLRLVARMRQELERGARCESY